MLVSDQFTLMVKKLSTPGEPQELRQRRREAEAIGQPVDGRARLPKVLLEIALAVEQLADEGLAGRHVGVGLDPHGADRLPLAAGDLLLDAREERRIVLLEEGVELRRRLVEAEVRVAVHQRRAMVEKVRRALRRVSAERPEPGEIDMGVAGQRERAGLRIALAQRGEAARAGIPARAAPRRAAASSRPAGATVEVRRQLPDPLRLRARRDARDIGGGGGRPVEPGERRPRRAGERAAATSLVAVEDHSRAYPPPADQEQRRARQLGVDQDELGRGRAGRRDWARRTAARHALGADREPAVVSGKRWWFGSRPNASASAAGIGDARSAPRRRGRARRRVSSSGQSAGTVTVADARTARPRRRGSATAAPWAMRLAVEGPAVERNVGARRPRARARRAACAGGRCVGRSVSVMCHPSPVQATVEAHRRSALHRAGHQRADDEALQHEEDDDRRDDGEDARRGEDLGRGLVVGALEVEDADRDRQEAGLARAG